MSPNEPRTWTLEHADTPPSMNATMYAHWRKAHNAKTEWQSIFETLLLVNRVPRNLFESVVVEADLRFPTRRRRDTDNFRTPLAKAFGDAAVRFRAIPDDTPEHFSFGAVRFLEPGPALTRLSLTFCVEALDRGLAEPVEWRAIENG